MGKLELLRVRPSVELAAPILKIFEVRSAGAGYPSTRSPRSFTDNCGTLRKGMLSL
jgi:hypothetical protein